jgi:predicted Zn-dependent peptidase
MSMESTGSRCEQLSRQLQIFGRIIPTAETIARVDAVTVEDIRRAAARIFRGVPTLAAMGPAERVPGIVAITDRLAA